MGARVVVATGLLAGLGLAATLYARYDLAELRAAVAAVGWGLAVVLLYRAVPVLLDALGWWAVLPPERRPRLLPTWRIRWISESVNTLLPVAQVGGEVLRARLITRHGLSPGEAGGSVAVDVTLGVAGTALFGLTGLLLLLLPFGSEVAAGQAVWGLAVLAALTALLWLVQRARLPSRVLAHVGGSLAGGAQTFDRAVAVLWRGRRRLAGALLWRLLGTFALAGEVWLILYFHGAAASPAQAVMLESLTVAARSAAFLVPGGLGVQEATLLLLGAALGLPADAALAVVLVKRLREVATGLPALALWWWVGR